MPNRVAWNRIKEERYLDAGKDRHIHYVRGYTGIVGDKVTWGCEKEHEWQTTYSNICAGYGGCPYCRPTKRTETDYLFLGKNLGYVFLGPFPKTAATKTAWECEKGHRRYASYSQIRMTPTCPDCSGRKRTIRTEEDYDAFGKTRGIWFVGDFPRNSHTNTTWMCEKGHRWEAQYCSIKNGNGCPECKTYVNGRRVSKPQLKLAKMLSAEVNYKAGKYCIDCALPKRMIAVEYDCWYWHAGRVHMDKNRAKEIIESGWSMLVVKSNNELPTQKRLDKAIAQLDIHPYIELILSDWGTGPTIEDNTK